MQTIPKEDLLENLRYYRRLLVLSEVADLPAEEVAERVTEEGLKTPSKIKSDLLRLKETIEKEKLPEECRDDFNEILDIRNQLETVPIVSPSIRPEELQPEQRKMVESRVDSSLNIDRNLGFATDEATEWFYRRLYTAQLHRDSV